MIVIPKKTRSKFEFDQPTKAGDKLFNPVFLSWKGKTLHFKTLYSKYYYTKGAFTNYVDIFLPVFDHLPPFVDSFYLINFWATYPPLLLNVVCGWPPNYVLGLRPVVHQKCCFLHMKCRADTANIWTQVTNMQMEIHHKGKIENGVLF